MTKTSWPPSRPTAIHIESGGKTYRGNYTVQQELITVSYPGGRSKSAQLGGLQADEVARLLLAELVAERQRHTA